MKAKITLHIILLLSVVMVSCTNHDLHDECPCGDGETLRVKVIMNWDTPSLARGMRMNAFSTIVGIPDFGVDQVPAAGDKVISLIYGGSYMPIAYDYYADNVYIRNETSYENIEAYSPTISSATYNMYATPVAGESTVSEPSALYVDAPDLPFDVVPVAGQSPLELHFYPKNVLRIFTFRINNVAGAENISSTRGAISGMSATYKLTQRQLSAARSTILFYNVTAYSEAGGYIEGYFYTFGPIQPYSNRFTIEVISRSNTYLTAFWDVSGQIAESMANREQKLARDGYDILINNNGTLPPIPDGGGGSGSGFEIDVNDWNNVEINL